MINPAILILTKNAEESGANEHKSESFFPQSIQKLDHQGQYNYLQHSKRHYRPTSKTHSCLSKLQTTLFYNFHNASVASHKMRLKHSRSSLLLLDDIWHPHPLHAISLINNCTFLLEKNKNQSNVFWLVQIKSHSKSLHGDRRHEAA